MAEKRRSFAVIGLGSFGATIARDLVKFGDYVIGVDIDERRVNAVADDISEAVILDARDETALREAGIAECEVAMIAIGDDLEANVMAAINARMMGIKTVWAKAANRNHHRILTKIGADRVIQPETEVGATTAEMLHNPAVRDFVAIGNGLHVVNIIIPERRDGTAVSEFDLMNRFDIRLLGVMRGTKFLGDGSEDVDLEEGDRMLLLGRRAALRDFGATL
ncbi:trk system potassium uptake protein TrkA [Tranquillimonas rosea]|uniref:Trk system potassium uptake protein TrkA n=1 Tax=Tranquillimonas rosea TaxID=641238 RepID=A0A1H9VXI8_9RHOB|nr:TrkA family potassium uptake protein [Tranquillimonas rosea]SES26204.1 trk system potassium uptake protein TrkA [Tranquillimonas rosea]